MILPIFVPKMDEKRSTSLAKFNNDWYKNGKSGFVNLLWFLMNSAFFKSFFPINSIKIAILRLFGTKIGKNVIIKPHVNIKYPWRLTIGNNVWIGEQVWIDNLANVLLEDDVCISQGAMLLCGNHHYKKTTFDLIIGEIKLRKGSWVGAKCVVCPGVSVGSHAVLTVGSVATAHLKEYMIYQGNPAQVVKERVIKE